MKTDWPGSNIMAPMWLFSLSADGTALPLDGLKSFQEGLLKSCQNAEHFQ